MSWLKASGLIAAGAAWCVREGATSKGMVWRTLFVSLRVQHPALVKTDFLN